MRTDGVWLAAKRDGKYVPAADLSPGDDIGHNFFLGLWSRFANRPLAIADVVRFNVMVCFAGYILLVVILLSEQMPVSACFFAVAAGTANAVGIGTNPHFSHAGIGAMIAVTPILALRWLRRPTIPRRVWAMFVLGFVCLAFAVLIRYAIGLIGIGVTTGICVFSVIGEKRGIQIRCAVLMAIAVLMAFVPTAVLRLRDACFKIEAASRLQSHGFSHSLYLGLGVENGSIAPKWTEKYWDDSHAVEAARRADPSVLVGSPNYYRLVRDLCLKEVRAHPAEVARIYLEKCWLLMRTSFPNWAPPLWCMVSISVVGFLVFMAWMPTGAKLPLSDLGAVAAVSFALTVCFVVQGIATSPIREYAESVGVYVLLTIAAGIETLGRLASAENGRAGG